MHDETEIENTYQIEAQELALVPKSESKCPFHKILNKLRCYAGLPVPFTVSWFGTRPDFRVINPDRVRDCVVQKKCAVCGYKLGDTAWWIGGPKCLALSLFADPAMHYTCAKESMRLCPFLNGKLTQHRDGGFAEDVRTNSLMTNERPESMYLMRGRTRNMKFVRFQTEVMIDSGAIVAMETF
jgi:hypothetical protein